LEFSPVPMALDTSYAHDSYAASYHSFEFLSSAQLSPRLIQEISEFLDSQDTSHPFQFPQWSGAAGYAAILRRNGTIRWFAQCGTYQLLGRLPGRLRALTVNRGPVSDDLFCFELGLQGLAQAATMSGFTFIEVMPESMAETAEQAASIFSRNHWQRLAHTRMSLRLKLTPDPESLLRGFRKSTRYEIRRGEKSRIDVRFANDGSDCETWLRIYQDMAERKKFPSDPPGHLRKVVTWLIGEPQRGGLLLAHYGGNCVGGVVIVRSGRRCWYLFGATSKAGSVSAGYVLQWRTLQWAKENGCSEYDFGGYNPEAIGGPAFFKSGFCQNIVHFVPAQRCVLSETKYRTAQIIQRVQRTIRTQFR
jgi:Acetyltransferase (GNAT) domain